MFYLICIRAELSVECAIKLIFINNNNNNNNNYNSIFFLLSLNLFKP